MDVMALRLTGERGPYRRPDTRGWGTEPEPERARIGDETRGSARGKWPVALTGEDGGESSVPDSGWMFTDGVTGTDDEAPARDVSALFEGIALSLFDLPEEPGLRGDL